MDEVDSLGKIRNRIEKQLKSFGYGNNEDALRGFSFKQAKQELEAVQKQAEKTEQSVQDISETQIKDVFQGDDKVNTDASTTAIKEES